MASFVEKKNEMAVLMSMALEADAKGDKARADELVGRAAAIEAPKKVARAAATVVKKDAARIAKKVVAKVKPARKSSRRTQTRASSSGRAFAGRDSTGMWACETCLSKGKILTFRSKAAVEAHESKHRGGSNFAALTVPPHARVTQKCKWCNRRHATSQHSSHGPGSFEATHPGQFPENDED